jgi:hypothetical protein
MLEPNGDADLPWSNGEQRILSRHLFAQADGNGSFYAVGDGGDQFWESATQEHAINTSTITKKGIFSIQSKELNTDCREMILVGKLNAAKNYISGEYELRVHTKPSEPGQLEAVDSGSFWLSLSSGPGHFKVPMFEGRWDGVNYHYEKADKYLNCTLIMDAAGNLIDGGVLDEDGVAQRRFDRTGRNDGAFSHFENTSIGLYGGATVYYQEGRELQILYLLMDENRTWLTGPAIDLNGHVSFLRLKRQKN